MKCFLIIIFCLLADAGFSQKTLAIDLYRLGHFKRLHINQHDLITYKLKDSHYTYTDTLSDMRDSMLIMGSGEVVRLSEIRSIKIDRSNWLLRKLYRTAIVGGVFIAAVDVANNIANVRPTVMDQPFIIVCSSMVAGGFILRYFCTRRVHPGENTRLRILDLSPR